MVKTINLDDNFKPLEGETIAYKKSTFTGGEPHFVLIDELSESTLVNITCRINSFNDLGLLLIAADAVIRHGGILNKLVVPYFPGARQDRVMNYGEPLSIKVYTDLINNLKFRKVIIFDPHSDVTPALLNNVHIAPNHNFIAEAINRIKNPNLHLVSPDGGALKKIYKLSEYLNIPNVIECSKQRDTATGNLNGFKVYDEDFNGQDILLVDDICDGGGTFLGVGNELLKHNIGKMYLAVSHGIFSKGWDELSKMYHHIFVTNSIRDIEAPHITQIKLNEHYLHL